MVTVIVAVIIFTWLIIAIIIMIRNKKNGKHISCGGNCQSCSINCKQKKVSQNTKQQQKENVMYEDKITRRQRRRERRKK